jgi:hypothetical protein
MSLSNYLIFLIIFKVCLGEKEALINPVDSVNGQLKNTIQRRQSKISFIDENKEVTNLSERV